MPTPDQSTTADISVLIAGTEVAKDDVHDVLVEAELNVPDMAAVLLSNMLVKHSEKITVGDDIEIKMGLAGNQAAGTVFKGEIVGLALDEGTGQKEIVEDSTPEIPDLQHTNSKHHTCLHTP